MTEVGDLKVFCEYRCRDLLEWHTRRRPSVREALIFSAVTAGLLYVVWAITVVLLYFACRWYADLKARRRDWWMTYL